MLPCDLCQSIVPLGAESAKCLMPLRGRENLLIVEDDPYLAEDLAGRLTSLNYGILGAVDSAEEAVSIAENKRPDVVLMDIQLAGQMDGIQAAETIRKSKVPVVYVTGYINSLVLNRAMRSEPGGYVLKPYETSDLKVAVETALQKYRAERQQEQLLKRFQTVLASLKTLTGLLHICAYCKKIKDESGNWPEIETYVAQHSYASFSHGMCPDCYLRMKKQLEALESGDAGPETVVIG